MASNDGRDQNQTRKHERTKTTKKTEKETGDGKAILAFSVFFVVFVLSCFLFLRSIHQQRLERDRTLKGLEHPFYLGIQTIRRFVGIFCAHGLFRLLGSQAPQAAAQDKQGRLIQGVDAEHVTKNSTSSPCQQGPREQGDASSGNMAWVIATGSRI
jgi:hypothetical protein